MINVLKALFAGILLAMLAATWVASRDRGVLEAAAEILRDPWGFATLLDAYCGFLTFYAWVFYKEPHALARLAWLVAILLLGNIAMSVYMLIQLYRLPVGAGASQLLLRRP